MDAPGISEDQKLTFCLDPFFGAGHYQATVIPIRLKEQLVATSFRLSPSRWRCTAADVAQRVPIDVW